MAETDAYAPLQAFTDVLVDIVCMLQNAIAEKHIVHAATAVGAFIGLAESQRTNGGESTEFDLMLYAAFGTRFEAAALIAATNRHEANHDDCQHCVALNNSYAAMLNEIFVAYERRLAAEKEGRG